MTPKKTFGLLFVLLSLPIYLSGSTDRFVGEWKATNNGITKVQIRLSRNQLKLRAFGACHPQDCDWGEVDVQAYVPEVCLRLNDTAEVISAQFVMGFAKKLLIAYPMGTDQLRVETFTVFTDTSGRSPYHSVTIMTRTD